MPSLKETYSNSVIAELKKKFGYENDMQVPKITKVTLNMGLGEAAADKKIITNALATLSGIAGQKCVATKAKKSVAGFKIREGWPIGVKVTLRREKMWDFLTRLLAIALPRVRDFRGLNPRSFDKQGNFSMGITDLNVFPEVKFDEIDKVRGCDITVSTTARNKEEGLALLRAMAFPLREK